MGSFKRILGLERNQYHATQLGKRVETTVDDTRGVLLEVCPNPENHGPGSMAAVYEAMYEPATKPTHSFEIWFYGGEARFFLLAGSPEAADSIRRSVTNNYADSEVTTTPSDAPGFPTISEEDYVTGAYLQKHHPSEVTPYLPIKYFDDGDGWRPDQNPIAEIISRMQTDGDSTVVVQATVQPLSNSWTKKNPFIPFDQSAATIKEGFRDEGRTDYKRMVEKQTAQSPFATNLRILSVSPIEDEARNRAGAVAGIFERKFNSSACGMGLSATSVDGRTEGRQRSKTSRFIDRMRTRKLHKATCTILGDEELTSVHIPAGESGAPSIDWKYARSGSDAPVNRPEHNVPSLDDVPEDSRPIVGGKDRRVSNTDERDGGWE